MVCKPLCYSWTSTDTSWNYSNLPDHKYVYYVGKSSSCTTTYCRKGRVLLVCVFCLWLLLLVFLSLRLWLVVPRWPANSLLALVLLLCGIWSTLVPCRITFEGLEWLIAWAELRSTLLKPSWKYWKQLLTTGEHVLVQKKVYPTTVVVRYT